MVSLTSSVDSVCPGGTVVFTCVTDTNQLVWRFNESSFKVYTSKSQANESTVTNFGGIFTLKLLNTTRNGLESTATAQNVAVNQNETSITCTGNINNPDAVKTQRIIIGKALLRNP